MATIQTEFAWLGAAPLRSLFKIITTKSFNLSIWMILTAQGQSFPNLILFPQGTEHVFPKLDLTQHGTVANTVKTFLGTRQGYTDPIGNVQKANLILWVAADQRQEDNIILFTLVLVHNVHFDPCELAGWHKIAQTMKLACVSSKDGNVLWFVVL